MTRIELLQIIIGRARANGFEFRRWYTTRLGVPWISATAALAVLESERRYYALLFSHEFAVAFWKAGEDISFSVPAQTFQRVRPDGSTAIVQRKAFTRRSARRDAWRYHLRQMALAEEPLRYIRKYLNVEDELIDEIDAAASIGEQPDAPAARPAPRARKSATNASPSATPPPRRTREKPIARALPTGVPNFLKRPYP
jgi:hypothetical protein